MTDRTPREPNGGSIQPITDAVYGDKPKKKEAAVYEPRGHGTPMWRRLDLSQLERLADKFPKARRFAARRTDR